MHQSENGEGQWETGCKDKDGSWQARPPPGHRLTFVLVFQHGALLLREGKSEILEKERVHPSHESD